jgi:hypothetical protein
MIPFGRSWASGLWDLSEGGTLLIKRSLIGRSQLDARSDASFTRCHDQDVANTGRELSTGIEMDAETFERLPDIRSKLMCPICKFDHIWSAREACSISRRHPPPRLGGWY